MKINYLYIVLIFIVGCNSSKDTSKIEPEDEALIEKKIEENRPRLIGIEFDFEYVNTPSYGFVMEGSWGENNSSTRMYITGSKERRELSKEDEKKVYSHLEQFYKLPNICKYLKDGETKAAEKGTVYSILTYDSDESKFKVYEFPLEHKDFTVWVDKFHMLHGELI